MKRTLPGALIGLAIGCGSAAASSIDTVRAALGSFEFGRYMEGHCTDHTFVGWSGFPTRLCRYTVSGVGTSAEVGLLDADREQLVRWIDAACQAAKTNNVTYCAVQLAKHIRNQSGAQFPVAGMVLEDMDGDGTTNQFAFRDGVTVAVSGVTSGKAGAPTSAENKAALENPPLRAKLFARIAGTTRQQYAAYAGVSEATLDGLAWLEIVRQAYQRAWGAASNDLINAWATNNASSLSKP
jgi:endoglucanase